MKTKVLKIMFGNKYYNDKQKVEDFVGEYMADIIIELLAEDYSERIITDMLRKIMSYDKSLCLEIITNISDEMIFKEKD
jgi:hypothetical protein